MNNINIALTVIIGILSIGFFARLIFKTFYLLWLFQLKEYRFDRLYVHFKETKEGRRFFVTKRELGLWIIFFLPFFYHFSFLAYFYAVAVIIVFAFETYDFVKTIKGRQFRRPTFSVKASVLTALTFFFVIPPILASLSPIPLVIVDRFLIVVVGIFVLAMSIPTDIMKKILMFLAGRKISGMKNLQVIGVTGSYGKSLTKELIADFLAQKYNVVKTPGSVNTDLGIALFVLKNLKPEHEVFVVEIGAYKRGEISSVCNMVKPTIGVLTGINEQHLSLFGSMENTKEAKLELIESLSTDGMAFFNGDDEIIKTSQVSRTRPARSTFEYSTKQLPTAIRKNNNPFLVNIAAAFLVGQKLGVDLEKLKKKAAQAVKTFGIKRYEKEDFIVLDDSFNTNPKGFAVALDILSQEKGKRILITPGIIELGNEAKRIHIELGVKMAKVCDTIILTNDNFEEPIREGLRKAKFSMENFYVPKRGELASIVKNQFKDKAAVLLEGRIPAEVKSWLSS